MAPAIVVVIGGPPGTGKTALAARLRDRHGWTVLAKDTIKESLFDTLGSGDRAWSRTLSDAAYELMFRLAEQGIGRERVLVLEGNFRAEHQDRIAELARSRDAGLLYVTLHADRDVLRRRLEERAASRDRHPGHLDLELLAEIERAGSTEPTHQEGLASAERLSGAQRLEFATHELDDALLERIATDVSRCVAVW